MKLMKFPPLQLGRHPEPFSHQDWLFEIKYDGFMDVGNNRVALADADNRLD